MSDTKVLIKRHLLKTISYRILSSFIGFLILFITTRNLKISLSFSLAEFLFKPLVYFIHERIWYKWIKFGVVKSKYNPYHSQFEDPIIKFDNKVDDYGFPISGSRPIPPPTKMLWEGENPNKKILNYSRRS